MLQDNINQPLDQPIKAQMNQRNPAVTWLIIYAGYTLLVRVLYTLISFLPTITDSSAQNVSTIYRTTNVLFSIGQMAIIILIMIFVKNNLSRAFFAVFAVIHFLMTVAYYFTSGHL